MVALMMVKGMEVVAVTGAMVDRELYFFHLSETLLPKSAKAATSAEAKLVIKSTLEYAK